MKRSQANRSVIARRAPAPIPTMPAHLRSETRVLVTGPVRKTRALPMTGAQRDSRGRTSDWARPADIGGMVGAVIRDGRWSRTVSDG